MSEPTTLAQRSINTIRMLAVDAVQKANSGHPGMPMGAAGMAYVLWQRFLRHNPANPVWPDRDRFILSAGHGSMLLYSLLHLTGYDLSLADLQNFRQWGSKTPGHPEFGHTPGVEMTTGPLGQGFATGVGMAIAERHLAARFNRPGFSLIDHYTYALVSDGDLMEGVSHEAGSLAGTLKLGKLIYLYDDNHISIEGSTDLAFTEDRAARFSAYGWQVLMVDDGNDVEKIAAAIQAAKGDSERPSLIAVRSHIGYGSPHKQDTASAHGEPLGADEVLLTKEKLDWPVDQEFLVPEEVRSHFLEGRRRGEEQENQWRQLAKEYAKQHADLDRQWVAAMSGELPVGWEEILPHFPADPKGMATRAASGKVINALAPLLPTLIGGSADLAPSNKTQISNTLDFGADQYGGRNLHFGVREHGMGSIMNGMALHGGTIPYGGTFLVFSDYMKPAIRLAAMMGRQVVYVFTHDSIGLGEDGPTHQPVEHLAALRSIPGLTVIRPADANETAAAWHVALQHRNGPTALILTRQNVPTISGNQTETWEGVACGAYIVSDATDQFPEIILMATGSEVAIATEAGKMLAGHGIAARIVSMPSWELFDRQSNEYRERILPAAVKARISIEAGATQGWHRYVGDLGLAVGIDHFGASAPYEVLYEKFGLTASRLVEQALAMLQA
ncbi:MAG: transketolase [Deltaproteobacteria bacterium]|nr:transketolase [Candidatus Anaeroferrophillus wilburensis]MBN2887762.1 transketolase [Deltaproteobacteria bacterium]